ncbi:hypothetical protein GCM10011529_00190 [Polymorphobacter glacialis]|uniref:Type IV pilus biogenesis protein PilP n=1 Tax=Sandarakinorhabdus glacialis TaxID=1614636 RepID=A0A917E3J9_9SPHN|nr:hypothetical protein [Polymorphobacter glacialis]GGD98135.1 hypothetical protein GCM10011529_00190 [Polymorphobacter glacialis]
MRRIAVSILVTALASGAAPAVAQAPSDLLRCAAVPRDAERLACYDAAVLAASPEARAAIERRAAESARLAAAEAAAAAVAAEAKAKADSAAREVAQRESFGAENVAARSAERFVPDKNELQQIESSITDVLKNTSGLDVYLLANGQMWRQADTGGTPPARAGDKVKVSRSALGGFHLTFLKQGRRVLVKRMR